MCVCVCVCVTCACVRLSTCTSHRGSFEPMRTPTTTTNMSSPLQICAPLPSTRHEPLHFVSPSLLQPLGQSPQVRPPAVLVHVRLLSQPPLLVEHSSTSARRRQHVQHAIWKCKRHTDTHATFTDALCYLLFMLGNSKSSSGQPKYNI